MSDRTSTIAHGDRSDRDITIVGLGGSLGRDPSTSLAALRAVLAGATAAGASHTRAFDVRELGLPMFEPGTQAPAVALELADAIHGADALVWASPMYHGTISGAFKNAIDWLELLDDRSPAYLTNKPVGLISTAGGVQGLQAINTMEQIVRALRGWTVPFTIPIAHAQRAFDADGRANDDKLAKQLAMLGSELVLAARRFPATRAPEIHAVA